MFSMVVFFGFHCDSIGLAAARTEVRAFSWQIIPACQKEKEKKLRINLSQSFQQLCIAKVYSLF